MIRRICSAFLLLFLPTICLSKSLVTVNGKLLYYLIINIVLPWFACSLVRYLDFEFSDYAIKQRTHGIRADLDIYCYRGIPERTIANVFQTVNFQLKIETNDFQLYEGNTSDVVRKHHANQEARFAGTVNWLIGDNKVLTQFSLNPFCQTCVGVHTRQLHSVHLSLIRVDNWKMFGAISGIGLFLLAPFLISLPIFHNVFNGILFVAVMYLAKRIFSKFGDAKLISYDVPVLLSIGVAAAISIVLSYRIVSNQGASLIIKWILLVLILM